VAVRPGPMVCSDLQVGPSAFWITNPNNTFIDNLAVDIGNNGQGIGYWIVSGGEIDKENSPAYMGTDYWTKDYQEKVAGLVFNPSRTVFGPSFNASGSHEQQEGVRLQMHMPAPSWMLGQQQGRTPLKEFRGNGVRSSFRGVHIDGFVTASVPGEMGDLPTDPEDVHPFIGKGGIFDGTCNYFPAGHYAIPSAEGMRVYEPMHFSYDGNGHARDFSPAWSIIDGLHISRCYDTWWSRASRVNVTNAIFAHNWVGMTNHIPGESFCPGTGSPSNPGLANNVVNSLFIGHGDDAVNRQLCSIGKTISSIKPNESPAGIRQYDGAFWLSNSHWVNMSTVACPKVLQGIRNESETPCAAGHIKTLPYALVAGRQEDCNGKFPIRLYNSWPLGASPEDIQGEWSWALARTEEQQGQNLGQFTGTASCERGPSGGVADMTGTLNPVKKSRPTAYFAASGSPANPGELASYTEDELLRMSYTPLKATVGGKVTSFAWAANSMENPDFAHTCGYCFYDQSGNCPQGPKSEIIV